MLKGGPTFIAPVLHEKDLKACCMVEATSLFSLRKGISFPTEDLVIRHSTGRVIEYNFGKVLYVVNGSYDKMVWAYVKYTLPCHAIILRTTAKNIIQRNKEHIKF